MPIFEACIVILLVIADTVLLYATKILEDKIAKLKSEEKELTENHITNI